MSAGHKENGRFAEGNQLWKHRKTHGRPRRSVEERYLKAMQQVVTVKDWRMIVLVALSHAKAGDKASNIIRMVNTHTIVFVEILIL